MLIQLNHETLKEGDTINVNHRSYRITGRMIQPMGRYGEVYPAVSIRLRRPCAIKIMIPDGSLLGPYYNHNIAERKNVFAVEIDLLSQLRSYPGVVHIIDHGLVSGLNLPVIVEELYDANKRIHEYNKTFSEEEAYCFSVQLFAMLTFIRQKKIAYKDFQKPHFFFYWNENARDGALKTVDWNLSSQDRPDDLKLENEIEGMKRNGLQNLYLSNSKVFKIIFKDKNNSAEEVLMNLLKYGAQENLKCPSAIPLKYRISAAWLKIQSRRR